MRKALKILGFLALLGLASCGQDEPTGQRGGWGAAPKIVTEPARLEHLVDEIEALGTVRANESIEIRPRIASQPRRTHFVRGGRSRASR